MVLDERNVFVGRSLVFLEVVKVASVGALGQFIGWVGVEGEEAREGLERVMEGRRECEFSLFFGCFLLLRDGADLFLFLFGGGLGVERNGGDFDGGYRAGGQRGRGRGRRSWGGRGGMGSANGRSGACTDGAAF